MNYHNVLNTTEGLFVFGSNDCGQLGLGDKEDRLIPTLLKFEHEIISIHCGCDYTIINTTDGLFATGNNGGGQLGLGDWKGREILTKLEFDHEIISISCGPWYTILNTTDGLFVFGDNRHGQLGLGDTEDRYEPTKLEFDHEIISISCGSYHTILNTIEGLFVFGDNTYGQLGLGDREERLVPTKLEFINLIDEGCSIDKSLEIISIHCGCDCTIINTTEGLFVFGENYFGQLGLGDDKHRYEPTKLEFFTNLEITSVGCGGECTMINTTDGLFVFGDNRHGQLGLGDTEDRYEPNLLKFFNGDLGIISIFCCAGHTIINTIGGIFVFGDNNYGQLGLGDREDRLVPTKMLGNYEIIIPNKKRIKSACSSLQ